MIITRVIDFPDAKAKAMVILDENHDYNIYLNARLSIEEQNASLQHEMLHITSADFDAFDVQEIESRIRYG